MNSADVFAIIGPTASGKSAYAIELAQEYDGVIVNFDSMQVYNALPILTAQPSAEEQTQVQHHLYGYIDPAESCNAARWAHDAAHLIRDLLMQGRKPILVGGTGLYFKALVNGLSPIPEIDPSLREELSTLDTDTLTQQLKSHDPEALSNFKPNDRQRIMRALEVFKGTGKSILWWQAQDNKKLLEDITYHVHVKNPDRDALADKINQRVHDMLDMGALEEVRDLSDKVNSGHVPEDAGIVMAHGFRVFRAFLNGETTLTNAIERTQAETRQYAKRQRTFLRHQLKLSKVVSIRDI